MAETIRGRKIPLLYICRQALKDPFSFMRLHHKDKILVEGRAMLKDLVGFAGNEMSDNDLCQYVQKHLTTCHFALWHDHSTVCGCEHILVFPPARVSPGTSSECSSFWYCCVEMLRGILDQLLLITICTGDLT